MLACRCWQESELEWSRVRVKRSAWQALTRAFLRYGCRINGVDVGQSPARQAVTRAFTRYAGQMYVASYEEGPEVEQQTFEQVQEVDVLAVGEVG